MPAATTKSKARPILFSPAMRRAIQAGTKSQTRRVMNPQPTYDGLPVTKISPLLEGIDCHPTGEFMFHHPQYDRVVTSGHWSPYGRPGDFLYVKETHWMLGKWVKDGLTKTGRQRWRFAATKGEYVRFVAPEEKPAREEHGWHKRPSIFMPRWASRIKLQITGVRVERLQDISEDDATAEGVTPIPVDPHDFEADDKSYEAILARALGKGEFTARFAYRRLWDTINGHRPGCAWANNPWIWVLEFRSLHGLR